MALGTRLRTLMRGALKTDPPAERPRYVDDTRPLLLELQARSFEARTVLDVGAADGRWRSMAAERFPSACSSRYCAVAGTCSAPSKYSSWKRH